MKGGFCGTLREASLAMIIWSRTQRKEILRSTLGKPFCEPDVAWGVEVLKDHCQLSCQLSWLIQNLVHRVTTEWGGAVIGLGEMAEVLPH